MSTYTDSSMGSSSQVFGGAVPCAKWGSSADWFSLEFDIICWCQVSPLCNLCSMYVHVNMHVCAWRWGKQGGKEGWGRARGQRGSDGNGSDYTLHLAASCQLHCYSTSLLIATRSEGLLVPCVKTVLAMPIVVIIKLIIC